MDFEQLEDAASNVIARDGIGGTESGAATVRTAEERGAREADSRQMSYS